MGKPLEKGCAKGAKVERWTFREYERGMTLYPEAAKHLVFGAEILRVRYLCVL